MLHHTNEELRTYKSHLGSYTPNQDITLYEHQSKVLAVRKHRELENLRKKYYFMRWGDPIGMIERGGFVPNTRIGAHINTSTIEKLDLPDEETLDIYLR